MLSRAEIKRRKQQSARDKARHRAEQEELERRRQQSLRDRIRHRLESPLTVRISQAPAPPTSFEETSAVFAVTMAPSSETKVRRTGIFSTTAHQDGSTLIPGLYRFGLMKESRSEL